MYVDLSIEELEKIEVGRYFGEQALCFTIQLYDEEEAKEFMTVRAYKVRNDPGSAYALALKQFDYEYPVPARVRLGYPILDRESEQRVEWYQEWHIGEYGKESEMSFISSTRVRGAEKKEW